MAAPERPTRNVIIVGGGAIGICTAYYLLHAPSPPHVTLVEAHAVAGAASGKAGGFLALDWHGPATTSLAQLSWRLHHALAQEHSGDELWGFRGMDSVSYTVAAASAANTPLAEPEPNIALEGSDMRPRPPPLDGDLDRSWLNSDGEVNVLGTTDATAQVYVAF
jgi:glycine/D-amino acid oxidase-like deaminating enzyme